MVIDRQIEVEEELNGRRKISGGILKGILNKVIALKKIPRKSRTC